MCICITLKIMTSGNITLALFIYVPKVFVQVTNGHFLYEKKIKFVETSELENKLSSSSENFR